jgi:hypothetical protein
MAPQIAMKLRRPNKLRQRRDANTTSLIYLARGILPPRSHLKYFIEKRHVKYSKEIRLIRSAIH